MELVTFVCMIINCLGSVVKALFVIHPARCQCSVDETIEQQPVRDDISLRIYL